MRGTYFFCYDSKLSTQLTTVYRLPVITEALHPQTGRRFWMFERTKKLDEALTEFNKR